MNYQDTIISAIAQRECEGLGRKTILSLQKTTEGMQSGDDSPLRSIWDEVCVQVQGQESVVWDLYLEHIDAIVSNGVKALASPLKQAIWLQTPAGMDWGIDNPDEETVEYCEEDIVEYVIREYILAKAADWHNARIEEYLATGEFD